MQLTNLTRQIFVISDIHLGGPYGDPGQPEDRGFRISTGVDHLTAFVNGLADRPADGVTTELVINGDFIDFLAEKDPVENAWKAFTPDPQRACAKLAAIVARDRELFDALGKLLRRGHRLTILLGNHDIELALPQVRKQLMALMGVTDKHAFEFIFDGEAYTVGDVLIEHGNRYDMFNVVDHDSLRRLRSLQSRQQDVPKQYRFDAPAGSDIVVSMMNPIKDAYPFVDLLKPETGGAIPMLLALEPGYRSYLGQTSLIALGARKHKLAAPALPGFGGDIHASGAGDEMFGGDIASYDAAPNEDQPGAATAANDEMDEQAALTKVLADAMGEDASGFLDELTPGTDTEDTSVAIGQDISAGETLDQSMGLMKLLLGRNDRDVERRLPSLLKALRALRDDKSFDRSVETGKEYLEAAEELAGGGFRCVVFGHTHLPKDVPLNNGARYLNTGTWADVMRFPDEIIVGSTDQALGKLREFVDDLQAGCLSRWIHFAPTYARLDLDGADQLLDAELCDYTIGDAV